MEIKNIRVKKSDGNPESAELLAKSIIRDSFGIFFKRRSNRSVIARNA